ncbi:MAG: hypothetical protein EHM47_12415 [Ignavibacteriales bacterium]|nr:MAG: hypothetical protein EHM47_12415 [Ignavibacteriales bacterium]
MLIGLVLMIISLYIIVWLFINTLSIYPDITQMGEYFDDTFSAAVAELFRRKPHAFFVAGISLIVSLQFLSLGFLSLQSKRYFEELFHLNTNILKKQDNSESYIEN